VVRRLGGGVDHLPGVFPERAARGLCVRRPHPSPRRAAPGAAPRRLLALSLIFLPIFASSDWKPQGDEQPIARILLLLLATIGLPYFLLSTTTPLLQAWYWRRFRSRVPYRLFALSNLASLLALVGFPLVFEPALDLKQLGWMWSFVFAGFVVLCALTARLSMNGFGTDEMPAAPRAAPLSMATQLQWLALAAMGSVNSWLFPTGKRKACRL